jgi:hypothetical protein
VETLVPFLVVGAIVFIIGAIIAIGGLKNLARRKRILATPTSPIRQAPGGVVEVKGRIAPSEQGLLQTPFSGRHAVWARITVQERRQRGRSSYWATIVNEVDGRSFFVDDGSGEMARILPQNATVILDRQSVANSGTFKDAPPHLEAFLRSRGKTSTGLFGFNKQMRYEEEILAPGDALYALGPSRRDAGPPVSDGYRMVPSSQLVFFAAHGNDGELILTNKTEDQLVSKMLWGALGGGITAGVGLLIALVGVVIAVVDSM